MANLQVLFATLLGSRRSYVEPDAFHASLLKEPWGDRKQQDAYQYLQYLLDTIGGYPGTLRRFCRRGGGGVRGSPGGVNVNVDELRLGFSNTTRNPEGILSLNNRKS